MAAVTEFKTYRNLYNRVIKSAKKLHFKKQLESNKKTLGKPGKFCSLPLIKATKKAMTFHT